jgi:pyruvate carboxylase subunit B
MKYFVTIGGRTVIVELDGEIVRVDGCQVAAQLEHTPGTPEIRIAIDGVATTVAVDARDRTLWRLVDRGSVREVVVEDERTRQIRLLAGAGKAVDGHAVVKAPMPGLVLRLLVAVGDEVTAGMPLLALEAMKMENELKAIGSGRVTGVLVRAGQAVEKGQKLLELGPLGPAIPLA